MLLYLGLKILLDLLIDFSQLVKKVYLESGIEVDPIYTKDDIEDSTIKHENLKEI